MMKDSNHYIAPAVKIIMLSVRSTILTGSPNNPGGIDPFNYGYTASLTRIFIPQCVDLGLPSGVKWATCNVGALHPEEYGGMFCWGEDWRMPTFDEMKELMEKCTWTKTQISETLGFEVKGPNGNSIFLPAAGSGFKDGINPRNLYGEYWSSTLDTEATKLGYEANPDVACGPRFES